MNAGACEWLVRPASYRNSRSARGRRAYVWICVELRHYFDLMQAYQDWASGAFERILADGLSCQQQIMAATGALASPPLAPSAREKEPEQLARPARSKTAAMCA